MLRIFTLGLLLISAHSFSQPLLLADTIPSSPLTLPNPPAAGLINSFTDATDSGQVLCLPFNASTWVSLSGISLIADDQSAGSGFRYGIRSDASGYPVIDEGSLSLNSSGSSSVSFITSPPSLSQNNFLISGGSAAIGPGNYFFCVYASNSSGSYRLPGSLPGPSTAALRYNYSNGVAGAAGGAAYNFFYQISAAAASAPAAAAQVPSLPPVALALLGLTLIGLVGQRRRKKT
ncbi:MAG: hypothetical protein OIF35_05325 [Cellvibrionaceae bacterium]|nr:hypothetical protein [Cellvibrionaceae bacterium]MCV6624666.1 hypothetical protein [Cellvibrionaceae bacterium]